MTIMRSTQRVYAALLIGAGAVALLIALTDAAPARHLLGFTFGGVRPSLGAATSIFVNNVRMASLPIVFALILSASPKAWRGSGFMRAGRLLMDAIVGSGVVLNVVIVGAAVGAYGARMLGALLPHGPTEVLAFAAALATYMCARRECSLRPRTVGIVACGCLVTLAVSAGLEAYLHPW